jgi:hypothetical protein
VRALGTVASMLLALALLPVASSAQLLSHQSGRSVRVVHPCAAYVSGTIKASKFLAGRATRRVFDRDASIYQVCEGFGAPDTSGFHLTVGMQCALVAAAAAYAGPPLTMGVDHVCTAQSIASAFADGGWLNGIKQSARAAACGWFSDVFAGAAAVFVAGAAAETGPGAVAVGVAAWKALTAGLRLACGGLLTGPPSEFGVKLEAGHETAVMLDIVRKGKCLEQTRKPVIGIQWWAVACPKGNSSRGPSSPPGGPGEVVTCGTRHDYPILAYNLSCTLALRYMRALPHGWTGSNSDWVLDPKHAGTAMLYPTTDQAIVFAAIEGSNLGRPSLAKLHGVPGIWYAEPYGE